MSGGDATDDGVPDADIDAPAEGSLSIEVLRGDPTAEELAALMAVVSEAYASEAAAALAEESGRLGAWAVSQRFPNASIRRELGWTRSTF